MRAVLTVTLGVLSLWAAPCHAEPKPVNVCEGAYERAQLARNEGDLLSATDNLVSCAGVSCPEAMQIDCNRWLEEVRVSLPTVVFRAVDARGADVPGATVSIDGHPQVALNGRAMPVNPGPHEVTLRASGFSAHVEHLQFVEGQKLRAEAISLTPLAGAVTLARTSTPSASQTPSTTDAPIARSGRRITATQWVAGGVAVVGAVGFAYFGSRARSSDHDLDHCSPNCSKANVNDVKRDYLYANVSLGVGLVAIATGVIQYLVQDPAAPQASQVTRLDLALGPRFVQLQGSF